MEYGEFGTEILFRDKTLNGKCCAGYITYLSLEHVNWVCRWVGPSIILIPVPKNLGHDHVRRSYNCACPIAGKTSGRELEFFYEKWRYQVRA